MVVGEDVKMVWVEVVGEVVITVEVVGVVVVTVLVNEVSEEV